MFIRINIRSLFLLMIVFLVSSCAKTLHLREINCMKSSTHNWVQISGKFVCAKAENECERDFIQDTDLEESCTANPECEFIPNKCYCRTFEGHQCICAGGPPQRCVLKTAAAD